VRQLHREGRLRPHQSFPITWQCGDQPFGGIAVRTDHDLLILRFQVRETDAKGQKLVEQSIPIVWTACALGGQRPWFQCNAVSGGFNCNRRAAKIFLGNALCFACRRCHGLAYASQNQTPHLRLIGKARKVRMRLGGSANLLEPFPDRPKGLHRKTYERLRKIYDATDSRLS
jgi:hypothetical protein